MLQVYPGREFMGGVTKEMEKHETYIRRERAEIHRDQAAVGRFNHTLAESLFGLQYAVKMLLPERQRSTAWVKRLPDVDVGLNNKPYRAGKKPIEAIKEKSFLPKAWRPYKRPVVENEKDAHPFESSVSLPTWRGGRWCQKSDRSCLEPPFGTVLLVT